MEERYQFVINKASTAIIMVNTDLVVDYVNKASLDLIEKHQREVRKIYPEFELEKILGTSLGAIKAIPHEALARLKDLNRSTYAKFLDVGKEKIHITIHPIISSGGADLGSAIEWWYATEYLEGQAHAKRIADASALIDELTFQANILSLNAAVEAAQAGEQGRSFAVIADEMRDLSQRCRAAAKELKANIN